MSRTIVFAVFMLVLSAALFPSCSRVPASEKEGKAMTMNVESLAFKEGGAIPKKHTGEGVDASPELRWSGAPEGTKELALICDDPDAPTPEPWVHWVIYAIPADAKGLREGVPSAEKLDSPSGSLQGHNSSGMIGYNGPMPPKGHGVHHYHFKLYALDAKLELKSGADKRALLAAMKGHVLAQGELVGMYQR